jgi:hypothetical protein
MAGDKKGEDMRADSSAYDDENVISSVAQHLAEMQGKKPPTPESDVEEDLEAEDDSIPEENDDKPAENDDSPTQDDDEKDEEAGEDDEKPALPDRLKRAAEHAGWSPEEISEFYGADPARALKTFEKMHASMNDLSRQFAEIGRTRIAMERQKLTAKEPEKEQPKTADLIDIKALRERDPDNELLPVVEALNEGLKKLSAGREQSSEVPKEQRNVQEDFALAQQITTFLDSDSLKQYSDFYGPACDEKGMPIWDNRGLTPGQIANRDALIQQADAIWVGAQMHGKQLSVPEALGMAHSLLTDSIRERKVREELVGKVKKRAKGMTLRSAKTKIPSSDEGSKPANEQELLKRTEERLRKLRGRV